MGELLVSGRVRIRTHFFASKDRWKRDDSVKEKELFESILKHRPDLHAAVLQREDNDSIPKQNQLERDIESFWVPKFRWCFWKCQMLANWLKTAYWYNSIIFKLIQQCDLFLCSIGEVLFQGITPGQVNSPLKPIGVETLPDFGTPLGWLKTMFYVWIWQWTHLQPIIVDMLEKKMFFLFLSCSSRLLFSLLLLDATPAAWTCQVSTVASGRAL